MVLRLIGIILILLLAKAVGNLYKVFTRIEKEDRYSTGNDAGYVAIGIMTEVILIIWIAIKVIS